jgi:hypothetical protein
MAKQKAKRPETKSVTLSTGTNVTGPVAAIDKMIRGDRGGKSAKRASKPAEQSAPEPQEPAGVLTQADLQGQDTPERPSRGASLAAWTDFAKSVGFQHDEKASRDEIRDAYEAEHPAE